MSGGLASVEPDAPLYRLGRAAGPVGVARLVATPAPDGTFGNRYDDPAASYRVLYASSQRVGAFLETLARFRPDLEVLAELEQIEGDDEPAARRAASVARQADASARQRVEGRFVDVGDAASLATLRTALAASAIHYGLDEIDAATIRLRAPRAFTQQVSRYVYERAMSGAFAGIRYRSRLGDECSTGRSSSPHRLPDPIPHDELYRGPADDLTCRRRSPCSV